MMKGKMRKMLGRMAAVVLMVHIVTADSMGYMAFGKSVEQQQQTEGGRDTGLTAGDVDGQLGDNADGLLAESTDVQPGEGTEVQPGEGTEEQPGEGAEQPGEGAEEQPGEGAEVQPGEGTEEQPGDDIGEEIEEPALEKPVLYTASRPDGEIKIKWSKVDGADEYVLYRSTKKNSGFRQIYKSKSAGSHVDKSRTVGKKYYYKVAAFADGRARRADSKTAAGRSLAKVALTEVSNLSGSRTLKLQWKAVKGAAGYRIKRMGSSGAYKTVAVVKGGKTSYTDKKLSGGIIYSYKVCAIDNNDGRGYYSGKLSQMAIDATKKMIALTYDDGPSIYTPVVLNALEKYGAHATFFVVGNRVNAYGNSIKREVALGCEIGNHTYGHNMLRSLSITQVQSVIRETNQAVKNQAGVDIHIMRPPGGSYTPAICAAANMPVILWSVDTLDWKTRSTASTIQCVKNRANDGAVVLMHDIHKPTVDAAESVIRYLKDAGYQMVTVSELAAYRGGMDHGKVYSQFRK